MELNKKIIGNRIKKERNNLGITQEELAIKLGLNNKSSISQYESGDAIPSDDIKILMSNLFECSIDYLLGKSDIRNADNINDDKENKFNSYYDELNDLGKQKATEYIKDLMDMPKYVEKNDKKIESKDA